MGVRDGQDGPDAAGEARLEISDLELVRTAAGGDGAAFHRLVDRHADDLYRLALSLSRTAHDAEDVLQETFTGAFRGLQKFNGQSSVKTWLHRILMRQAARVWNRASGSRKMQPLASPDAQDVRPYSGAPSANKTARVDQKLDLAEVLETLDEDHREVIVLRELNQMSYAEIAEALGVPQGTVESRLHRARKQLRTKLKAYLTD
jgi:RNA polymerase sigma-70 factor (ECF subfamily)